MTGTLVKQHRRLLRKVRAASVDEASTQDLEPVENRALINPATASVVFLALFAAAVTLYATKQGVGLMFDSMNYLITASNLGNGYGLRSGTLEPLTIAPPGLPMLLAPAVWLGWNEESAARYVNVVCYGALVVLAYNVARRHLRSAAGSVFVAAGTAFSSSLLFIMTVALTEPMFCLIVLAFIAVAERNWTSWSAKGLAYLVVLTWCAFMFRYIGLFLIPCGVLCLLVSQRGQWRRAGTSAAAFLAGAAVVPVLVMAWIHAADGTWMGLRPNSEETFSGVRKGIEDTLQLWAWPEVTSTWAYSVGFAVAVAVGIAVATRQARAVTASPSRMARSSVWPSLIIGGVYLANLVYAELTTSVDPIDRRLLAPLFVPAVILVTRVVQTVTAPVKMRTPVLAGVASLVLVVQLASTLDAAKVNADDGIFMQNDDYLRDPQALAMDFVGPNDVIYSNIRFNFWLTLRHQPARYSPRHFIHHSSTSIDEVPAMLASLGCGPAYLSWYGKADDPPGEYLSPTELRDIVNLRELATFPTGINYAIEPKQPVATKTEAECKKLNLRK